MSKQLTTLYKVEQDREQHAANELQLAETDYQQNIIRLQSVSDYRLEYMKRLNQRSLSGIDSATYSHFLGFINKLDNAAEQMKIAISQAKALVVQRKELWLKQRQKVQAVETLIKSAAKKELVKANKIEQKMFDEIANQQFFRRQRQ